MKKLNFLTLLLLAVTTCLPTWAEITYQLIDQTNGTLTGAVRFTNTIEDKGSALTIQDKANLRYYALLSSNIGNIVNANTNNVFDNLLAYDIRSTETTIKVYVDNVAPTAERSLSISEIKEGETTETPGRTSRYARNCNA